VARERGDPAGIGGRRGAGVRHSLMLRRRYAFEVAAIAANLALALTLRATAWPEVTTPAYLWSRGLLMYRDIKFVHTPGMIGLLAAAFRLFGVGGVALHVFSLVGPIGAHGFLLRETRKYSLASRAIGSLFFLSFFYGWNGNSIWPVPMIAALAIPAARALEERHLSRAAALIGLMILLKQTSAYLLIVVVVGVLLSGKPKAAAAIVAISSVPYFAAAAAFSILGAGRDFVRWTLVVPFTMAGAIASYPSGGDIARIALAFGPLIAWTIRRDSSERNTSRWLLATAFGLALITLPRFDFLEAVAAVPCLALGASRWMQEGARRGFAIRATFSATIAGSFAATLALGGIFDRSLLFWNGEPAFERLIREIDRMPAAPLVSKIWENVLPRTGRLPPGRLYFHPWLPYEGPVDGVAERIEDAAHRENAIVVSFSRSNASAERCGPYWIERAGDERPASSASRNAPPQVSTVR